MLNFFSIMKQLIIVSSNPGKLKEYQDKLKDIECIPYQSLYPTLEIEETGDTFQENALIKAKAVFDQCHLPCVADDSGLIVEALPGELGVHSKRFSKAMTDEANITLLLEKLKHTQERHAYFHNTICLLSKDAQPQYFEGQLHGTIIDERRGQHGFGYDPIFLVDGLNKTLAECTLSEKNQISHRSIALEKLLEEVLS